METSFLIFVISILILTYPIIYIIVDLSVGTFTNKYNKYIIYEHYDKKNSDVKCYSADVAKYMLFKVIPIYTKYSSMCADKNDVYWYSKEKLLQKLNKDFLFESREKTTKIITRRID